MIRRLFTRLLAIVPSMIVAVSFGRSGVDTLLVASQVVLSIVLPFILFPLLLCTSSKAIMSVKKIQSRTAGAQSSTGISTTPNIESKEMTDGSNSAEVGAQDEEVVDYSNNKVTTSIGAVIWLIIVGANVYALVELGIGHGSA